MSVINTNIMSLNAQRNLLNSQSSMQTSMQRLSSGLRINSAKDDAAGLGIGKLMGNQIASFNQGIRNANDGISMIQTAEGALEEAQVMVQRVKELATQAANGTLSDDDRSNIAVELNALGEELNSIAERTSFNGLKMLANTDDSDAASNLATTFQVGASSSDTIEVTFENLVATTLSDLSAITGETEFSFDETNTPASLMDNADLAMTALSSHRASLGAAQNRLEHAVSNLSVMSENLSAAKSRIMDADFAAETANLTRAQVLQQAGTAMLAQANQAPQNVLSLLR